MQDPSTYSQVKPQFPEQEHLKCPRCDSSNTKFCYYNNYNLSQPRHFCKNCRRYWTKGGTLRNIPIGGGSRKNTKRSSNPKRSSTLTSQAAQPPKQEQPSSASAVLYDQVCSASDLNQDRSLLEIGGSFSSLLEGNGQFGDMLEGLNSNGSPSLQLGEFAENLKNSGLGSNLMRNPIVEFQGSKNSEGFLGVQNGGDSSCWSGTNANGWPDLAINAPTPGSSFKQTKVANFERENVS